jgi:CRISPR-associated protein Csm1
MLSIFCDIEGLTDEQGQSIPAPQNKYLPLKELKIRADTIFPGETQADSPDTYKALWDQFEVEAKILKQVYEGDQADRQSYLSNLLKLIQRYGWSIPSAYYQARPDLGLYDHSRMTGALAACLIDRDEAVISDMLNRPDSQAEVALLVGGDISGVQKFIYTITSRGATSGLRGRSMYLQLLTELAARYVLTEIGMPLTNLIYAGGGHFYLLAPIDSETQLRTAQERISRLLLHQHQGDLYLALGQVTLHAHEFHGSAFSAKWRDLTQTLQAAKQRQFSELGPEMFDLLFKPKEHGGNDEKLCDVCQREHPQTTARKDAEGNE